MDIEIEPTALDGVMVFRPAAFEDERGVFFESWSRRTLAGHGLALDFVQDNHSRSRLGVVRGLHYQDGSAPQHRLVRCTAGAVWDVAVDLRLGASTFGHWIAVELRAEDRTQVLLGPAFAHGFVALTEGAEVQYKCSGPHVPAAERSLAWDDPALAIPWPVSQPIVSARDRSAPRLEEYLADPAYVWEPAHDELPAGRSR